MSVHEAALAATETPQQQRKRLRKVAAATIFGSMLEWYDFYLYATMAAIVFSQIFFDASNPAVASLLAFSTFAIGFIARPFGGILFGYLGDRFGRKQVLVITFCMMGVCTALIGLIPSYATIGIWAPIILVVIRIIQGLGAGAELSGAAVTSYEHASEGKRGSQGAWPALGLNLGLLLSSLTVYLLTMNGNAFLMAGGWRIPFIASIALVGIGLWVRRSIPETPDFKELDQAKDKPQVSPLKLLLRNDLKGLAVVFFVAIGYNALSYIFKTFSLAYLTQFKGVQAHVTSLSVTIASLVAIFAVPFFGWLCDKWSSKIVLMLGGVFSALFAYPFLQLLSTGEPTLIYVAIGIGTGILAPMMFAPQGSFLSRQFPTQTRSSGFGTGREIGTAVAGGLAPLGGLALVAGSATHSTDGVALILAISGVLVVVFALCDQGRKHSTAKN
ncbi:MHS family MFS transporter [Pseudomonas guariconensis]|uniref:MFS transporter n=1 Tax=Pseudomonas TaxID=286 RepID=UPI001CE44597|nr:MULTISPECIES: MFS transporter [Pseudomonas]MCO7636371.1 MHS family MFS transporter [Pseudomonas sp. S 311-6]MCO7516045.1 MHS family MFS transporter [Pseudomonas putida]MCO7563786.1 MHS family MFS transporter [Pseudomonas mosselii]MCO7594139.1 MHS family MFS transporter [Pseudomonas guariconensis]MCO7606751.1 MHS family MFS transporter [Pseudomonas guariconensis]